MGAASTTAWGGGRWTAVYSLWTYIHRVLHILGVAAVDNEEVALLSAPLIRLRLVRRYAPPLLLAHDPTPQYPDEPLGWIPSTSTPPTSTLFFMHVSQSLSDRVRLATASPTPNLPRAWLAVDNKSGRLSLTSSEHSAASFQLIPTSRNHPSPRVALHHSTNIGRYLTLSDGMRARLVAQDPVPLASITLLHIPLPPTLLTHSPPDDPTLSVAFNSPRVSHVRLQSVANGFILCARPGLPLSASRGATDAGWDIFSVHYDSHTSSLILRDARGVPLTFNDDMCLSSFTDATSAKSPALRSERFVVRRIGDDGCGVVLMSRRGFLSARRGGKVIITQSTETGPREIFRMIVALPSEVDQSTPRVQVRHIGNGVRETDGSICAPVRAHVGYQVLKDYEGFPTFLSDMSESGVLHRTSDSQLRVKMVQCHSFLVLRISVVMVLDVDEEEDNNEVRMSLVRGTGIREYRGMWRAEEQSPGRCLLKCKIAAATSVPAPGFLTDGLMAQALATTLTQLREECIRRSSKEGTV